jgi:uncharacterized protein (DUF302 family)
MSDYGRRIVVDENVQTVIHILNEAMEAEGLRPLAQIDVREQFARELSHDFRRYVLVHAWSPEFARDALRHNLDVGTVLPVAVAVYELGDGETAVVANRPFAPFEDDYQGRGNFPALASIADRETQRLARVIDRISQPDAKKKDAQGLVEAAG